MSYKYNLGNHCRKISTPNPKAGKWFNRGLIWMYAFDLEMAGRCFGNSIRHDDQCAIAYWGLAYASGIYYNMPWNRMQPEELTLKLKKTHAMAREALNRIGNASPVETIVDRGVGRSLPVPGTGT